MIEKYSFRNGGAAFLSLSMKKAGDDAPAFQEVKIY